MLNWNFMDYVNYIQHENLMGITPADWENGMESGR